MMQIKRVKTAAEFKLQHGYDPAFLYAQGKLVQIIWQEDLGGFCRNIEREDFPFLSHSVKPNNSNQDHSKLKWWLSTLKRKIGEFF
jgi:hypothetical protein